MSVEQVARNFVMTMLTPNKLSALLTPDAMLSGGVVPQPVPAAEAVKIMQALTTAFPDLKFDIQQVTVDGNTATVKIMWGGTLTAPLSLPIPGMATIPPTGKKALVKDGFLLTVEGDKVSAMKVESPADGGIPGALAQVGVKMPGM
jgi:hypothetical protein